MEPPAGSPAPAPVSAVERMEEDEEAKPAAAADEEDQGKEEEGLARAESTVPGESEEVVGLPKVATPDLVMRSPPEPVYRQKEAESIGAAAAAAAVAAVAAGTATERRHAPPTPVSPSEGTLTRPGARPWRRPWLPGRQRARCASSRPPSAPGWRQLVVSPAWSSAPWTRAR